MKKINIVLCFICVIVVACMPLYNFSGEEKEEPREMQVLTLANLSYGSTFLNATATKFNKIHGHIYIEVINVTMSQLSHSDLLARVNIFCFDKGFGSDLYQNLKPYNGALNIRDELATSGQSGGHIYGVAWGHVLDTYYMGVSDSLYYDSSVLFVEYLTSDEVQKNLTASGICNTLGFNDFTIEKFKLRQEEFNTVNEFENIFSR